jgi:hypothetical protein
LLMGTRYHYVWQVRVLSWVITTGQQG